MKYRNGDKLISLALTAFLIFLCLCASVCSASSSNMLVGPGGLAAAAEEETEPAETTAELTEKSEPETPPSEEEMSEKGTEAFLAEAKAVSAPFFIKIRLDQTYLTLDRPNTATWRSVKNGQYRWNDIAVRSYFEALKAKYDTPVGEVVFKTHKGDVLHIKTDYCGWHMNIDMTVQLFEQAVDQGEKVFEPAWNSGLVYSSESEVGTSYLEVDIQEQKVYLYSKGELILVTDCVTGNADGSSDTTPGCYQLYYKTLDTVLKGEDNYGYKYEQPVHYWMPFNGAQGLHDATWRSEFGGSIYLTNGSHGCVNLPLSAAEKIYQEVYMWYPVILY